MNGPLANESRPPDRVDRLIEHLPSVVRQASRWLRQPSSRWARIPAGVLLIIGGLLSILPVLGLWMLPLGAVLLAEDLPALRRLRERVLDRIERHRPHWFGHPPANTNERADPAPARRHEPAAPDDTDRHEWAG